MESAMPVELALYQPDIANNTGTLIRLGACLGTRIHLIHPTGFPFSAKALARAGLDYVDHASVKEHASWSQFDAWRRAAGRRLVLLTTKAETSAYSVEYQPDDILMVGRESAGVPDAVADAADLRIRIPMREGLRSINVALAATLILGEAKRQTDGFTGLA
jgi:tRNA (cytidine/uridine-2'-O-)-methyltransferase